MSLQRTPAEIDPALKNQSRDELQAGLDVARKKMSSCVIDHAWPISLASVLLSVPVCIRYKTYTPFVFAIVSGSGLDYVRGIKKCQQFNDDINQFKYAIACIDHPEYIPR